MCFAHSSARAGVRTKLIACTHALPAGINVCKKIIIIFFGGWSKNRTRDDDVVVYYYYYTYICVIKCTCMYDAWPRRDFRPLYTDILYYEKVNNHVRPLESDSSYLNK